MATYVKSDQSNSKNKKQFRSIVSGLINDPRTLYKLSFADVVTIMKDYNILSRHLASMKLSSNTSGFNASNEIPIIKVSDFSTEENRSLLPESSQDWRKKSYFERLMVASENQNYLKVPGHEYQMVKHKSLDAAYMHKFRKNTHVKPSTFSTYFASERKDRTEKSNLKRRFSDGYKFAKTKLAIRPPRLLSVNSCALISDQIYRLGQTKLHWRSLPSKQSQGTVLAGSSHRDQLTVLFCSNLTGNHKLRPLVVGSSSDPRVIQNFDAFVVYKYSKDAKITPDILKDWFFEHFVPEVSSHLNNQCLPQRSLLALDPSVNRHPPLTELVFDRYQIKTIKLTNKIDIDQTVVGLVRVQYKKRLLLDAVACPHKFTKLADAIALIRLAWDKVKAFDIEKCCRYILPNEDKCCCDVLNPTATLRAMQLQHICLLEIQELLSYFPGGNKLTKSEVFDWIYFDQGNIINKNPFF